ncbi:MAG: GH3 auxin-responsive promoter family protein [Gammaproteobacteria bacterium]|nr:GH3 auxin-responsive promoter family protein [Gammaproteobacteria bacterium]MDH5802278.1 GH3 auxin-responsive promoter family protein [Gammaproteobacteria bacterium]
MSFSSREEQNSLWRQLSLLACQLPEAGSCEDWLWRCLKENQATDYGHQCQFERIQSVDDYREFVPLCGYGDAHHSIERIAQGEPDILFKGRAVAFEITGGSGGGPKLIPYSSRSLEDFRLALLPWLGRVAQKLSDTAKAYWAISPAMRMQQFTTGGIPLGLSDGAYLGKDVLPLLAELSAVPSDVAQLTEYHQWQRLSLYYLLRSYDLQFISIWSPTFFITLLDGLLQQQDSLLALLRFGCHEPGMKVEADAQALQRFKAFLLDADCERLWPQLSLVSCWTHASSETYYHQLQQRLPYTQFEAKGLLSTEGVVTVPDTAGLCRLARGCGFYEFLHDGDIYLPRELQPGSSYEVIMTTSGGLYRYRTGDRVVCESVQSDDPVLRFEGRMGRVSDLVGEKLTESFVSHCIEGVSGFRMLVPSKESKPGYILLVDSGGQVSPSQCVQQVERQLKRNPQYAYALQIGQLRPLRLGVMEKALSRYLFCASKTQRLGDIKVPALLLDTDRLSLFTQEITEWDMEKGNTERKERVDNMASGKPRRERNQ